MLCELKAVRYRTGDLALRAVEASEASVVATRKKHQGTCIARMHYYLSSIGSGIIIRSRCNTAKTNHSYIQ